VVRATPGTCQGPFTGSAGGLGWGSRTTLLSGGHEVIVHARSAERLAAVNDLTTRALQPSSGTWPT
jgi:NADP-dependent 3-hydroxy acid dehydrogenase YdfG